MPSAEHLIEFHGVIDGSCWAAIVDEPAVLLEAQDVILFPQGDAHVLSSAPGMRPPGIDRERYFGPRPSRLPGVLSVHGAEVTPGRAPDDAGDRTTVVCGFLGFDARPFNPLLAALPRVLRVPGATLGADSWVATFLRTAAVESDERRPGGEAVFERMSEMLFVEVLRRYIAAMPPGETGWLAGMHDPVVGHVLALIHERPEAPSSLEGLADAVPSRARACTSASSTPSVSHRCTT